jgi:hypothetical protein
MIKKDTTYNGWFNRDTWLIALWLNNDYRNYTKMLEDIDYLISLNEKDLKNVLKNDYFYHYDNPDINNANYKELNAMLKETKKDHNL